MTDEEQIMKELLEEGSLESILDNETLCQKLCKLPEKIIEDVMDHFNKKKKDPYSQTAQKLDFNEINPAHPGVEQIYSMVEVPGCEDLSGARELFTVGAFYKDKLASVYAYQVCHSDGADMDIPYLAMFGVAPDFQREGVGKKTLDHFVENVAGDYPLWFTFVHKSKKDVIDWYEKMYPLEEKVQRKHDYVELVFTTCPSD